MPFSSWKDVLLRTWQEQSADNISLAAAGVAFYAFLALVPLLGAIVLTYGIAADPQTVIHNMKSLTSVLPADVATLIGDQLMNVVQTSGSKKGTGLIIALAIALWGARNAATSIMSALNIAFEEEETRSTIRMNLLALAITCGGVMMAVFALLAITALGYVQKMLPQLPDLLVAVGNLLSYIGLLFGAAAGAATLYRFAPSRREAKWQWVTPGSMLSAVLWLVLTLGFGVYVTHFGNYNKTYGTLATVVILITWMYLSAYVFLLGAELNSELEHQAPVDGTASASMLIGAHEARCGEPALSGNQPAKAPRGNCADPNRAPRAPGHEPSLAMTYAMAHAADRTSQLAGMKKVGLISTVLSILGLSLLRKRGQEGAGAVLVAGAVGLSLLRRKD